MFFFRLVACVGRKKSIFVYIFTELKLYHLSNSINIADPSSTQDACHMNFVIHLAHRRVSVAQWQFLMGTQNFFFVSRS